MTPEDLYRLGLVIRALEIIKNKKLDMGTLHLIQSSINELRVIRENNS